MATNKNLIASRRSTLLLAALLAFLTGCGPPGPRAFLKGKSLLEHGDFPAAVEQLTFAAKTIGTNAQVWNYLGLACHRASQYDAAAEAYQKALKLNPDLVVVHFNLGCLFLDANRPDKLDAARTELTAFTLLQGNSAQGWLKLGVTQLRLKDVNGADKSFRQVLMLAPSNAAAWNGLGLVESQRNHPREAINFLNTALARQPGFAPALLNLAVIYHTSLNNRPMALQKYNEYLALHPRPADWDAVNAVAKNLQLELNPSTRPPTNLVATLASPPATAGRPATNQNHPVPSAADNQRAENPVAQPKSNGTSTSRSRPAPVPPTVPEIVLLPDSSSPRSENRNPPPSQSTVASNSSEPLVATPPDAASDPSRPGFLQRINPFRRGSSNVETPVPQPETAASPSNPVAPSAPRIVTVARYNYVSPARPTDGDRAEAERLFARAVQAQGEKRYRDAESLYRSSTQVDAGFFEAQSNLGLAAFQLNDMRESLLAYETALAIKPDSFNARFNFGLSLAKANYPSDAARELERLLVAPAADQPPSRLANVHLTLANLYAEQFHQPASARPHYLKVLELDPQNSQASAIRYWLRDNP